MPELPEVEVVARKLSQRITGKRITRVDLRRPEIVRGGHRDLLELPIENRRIEQVRRVGKLVRVQLSGGPVVHIHLGMTGKLLLLAPGAPAQPHTHLVLGFARAPVELRFCDPRRFGGVWITNGVQSAPMHGRRIPPAHHDPLELTLAQWREHLRARRQIKALLMAQDPISGVGNIYCDESLHRAGVHPLTRACDLRPQTVDALFRSLRRVLREAIRAGGSSVSDYRGADNARGWFQTRHRVYGQAGKPCRRCGTAIERIVISGRGTHLCPRCQKRWRRSRD